MGKIIVLTYENAVVAICKVFGKCIGRCDGKNSCEEGDAWKKHFGDCCVGSASFILLIEYPSAFGDGG